MNTALIANHLNIETHMIVRIERWKTVLFVVIRGVGARFVSYKILPNKSPDTEKTLIKKMIAIGGNRWQAHGRDRVYFDSQLIAKVLELSNSKTRQIGSCKFYYDVTSGEFNQLYAVITHGVHDRTIGGNIHWVVAIQELLAVTEVE